MIDMNQFTRELNFITNRYGVETEVVKCMEEMAEFTQVLCKLLLNGYCETGKFIEELADVKITVANIERMYCSGIAEIEVQKVIKYKLKRAIER